MDPHYGNEQPHEEPEAMDLPDDLNLDDEEKEEGGDKDGAETEGDLSCYHILDSASRGDSQDFKTFVFLP